MKNVLSPIEPPYTGEVSKAFENYPQADGYILQLFRVFANSMRFLTGRGVVNLLDKESPLSLREREIVILRTCANRDCEYEWGVHVSVFTRAAGLTEEQVRATKTDEHEVAGWSPEDMLLIKVVDELCLHAKLLARTCEGFQEEWSLEQQLEILALCGNYHTVSFVANTSRLPGEAFAAKFPWTG